MLQLALPQPRVAFSVYDHSRKTFLLRLPKGRAQLPTVAAVLGHPATCIAVLPPPQPATACAVGGFAAMPPHGHATTARQWCYINGACVHSPRIALVADGLFQQLFKANAALALGRANELQSLHKASNRHAAFVLYLTWVTCAWA